jgi:hypothetical protein
MALFFDARNKQKSGNFPGKNLKRQLRESTENISHVIIGKMWSPRFAEIEWPCLIWLNWIVGFGEFCGFDVWPAKVEKIFYYPGFKMGKESKRERKRQGTGGKEREEDMEEGSVEGRGRKGQRRKEGKREGGREQTD